jgi:hypothetical protein
MSMLDVPSGRFAGTQSFDLALAKNEIRVIERQKPAKTPVFDAGETHSNEETHPRSNPGASRIATRGSEGQVISNVCVK